LQIGAVFSKGGMEGGREGRGTSDGIAGNGGRRRRRGGGGKAILVNKAKNIE